MKNYFLLLFTFFIVSCGGDAVKDANLDLAMTREAMCVAASERFLLYKEAANHLEHGLSAGSLRFERRGTPNDFGQQVLVARKLVSELSLTFSAKVLKDDCNRPITNMEFMRVNS